MKPTLILTVGLPRSGKSTWAFKQIRNGIPVVNPDSIRLAIHGQRYLASAEPLVWAHAKIMVRSLFLAGHTKVILDATNTLIYRRELWNDEAWDVVYKVFDTTPEECIRRSRALNDEYIVPVILKMASEFEPLDPSLPRYDIRTLEADAQRYPPSVPSLAMVHGFDPINETEFRES